MTLGTLETAASRCRQSRNQSYTAMGSRQSSSHTLAPRRERSRAFYRRFIWSGHPPKSPTTCKKPIPTRVSAVLETWKDSSGCPPKSHRGKFKSLVLGSWSIATTKVKSGSQLTASTGNKAVPHLASGKKKSKIN